MSLVDTPKIDKLFDDLFDSKAYIAFFIHGENCYWIVDDDEYFNLDHSRNIEAVFKNPSFIEHIPKGKSVEEYKREVYRRYRSGIPILTSENFPDYIKLEPNRVLDGSTLAKMISSSKCGDFEKLYDSMELNTISGQTPLTVKERSDLYKFRTLLPTYYINFNRKIYMHMRKERFHEEYVHQGWYGAEGDFEHMIPIKYRYWEVSSKLDYWAINNYIDL